MGFSSFSSQSSGKEWVAPDLAAALSPEVGNKMGGPTDEAFRVGHGALNPYAREWHPLLDRAPEEERCLFFIFSYEYPLSEADICFFFTQEYGACVESVYISDEEWEDQEGPNDCERPLFGRIVFTSATIPAIWVSNGDGEVKFSVFGKPLWCKKSKTDHEY